MEALFADSTFWVLVALVLFGSLLVYLGVPGLVTDALDERTTRIGRELEEARQLRDDAQELLAEYQRKQKDAEKEAADIIERAEKEAERLQRETDAAIAAQLERRTRLAEQKIAQAEARAMAEVRSIAADVAIGAARRVLDDRIDDATDATLIAAGTKDLERTLKAH